MRILSAAIAATWLLTAVPASAEAPAPYADLPGTAWVVTEWNGAAPKPPHIPRITFGPANALSGGGGCNSFTGRYTVEGARIALVPMGWTKMMCHDGRMEIDMRLGADLRRVERLALGGDGILVAHAADGAVIFRFRRAQPNQ